MAGTDAQQQIGPLSSQHASQFRIEDIPADEQPNATMTSVKDVQVRSGTGKLLFVGVQIELVLVTFKSN